ncbi:MAG: DUF2202 domain-containing protein [Candidatus Nanopelagicales bacterium]
MNKKALLTAGLAAIFALGPLVAAQAATLSPSMSKQLVYLVQEEKLARDVYTTLYARTGVRQFKNIASAEQSHMSQVEALLRTYGIADPTIGLAAGSFKDASLTALYKKLVANGSTSAAAALASGVAIEKKDINDINTLMQENPPTDISAVLVNLRNGSQRHLAAFSR